MKQLPRKPEFSRPAAETLRRTVSELIRDEQLAASRQRKVPVP